ncbi:hypothetical protein ACUNWD_10865 [Sunxiuqinia sp. A32]|uniref:hypothetical protein n=1 Tax=Sunxiuqinia sp. A32 TaxID=3461496 RepID=UPI0040455D32
MKKKNEYKNTWIIGSTTMLGLGIGFIFLQNSVQIFAASLIIGIGVGLVVTSANFDKILRRITN